MTCEEERQSVFVAGVLGRMGERERLAGWWREQETDKETMNGAKLN